MLQEENGGNASDSLTEEGQLEFVVFDNRKRGSSVVQRIWVKEGCDWMAISCNNSMHNSKIQESSLREALLDTISRDPFKDVT